MDFVELNLVERLPSLELRVISVSFIAKKVVNTASQILWKIHNIIARYSKKTLFLSCFYLTVKVHSCFLIVLHGNSIVYKGS